MSAGAAPAGVPAAPELAAVVVNHNAGPALVACLASLRKAGIATVVVVDNASSDGSLEAVATADPAAVLVPTGVNLGYGTAVNRGMGRCSEELVLVCNPDLVVDPGAPLALAAALEADPAVAVVGPLIVDEGGATYPSARAFPSPAVAVLHAAVSLVRPDNRWSRTYRREQPGAPAEREADWVSGACMLVRRTAFASVGGFDEAYFMYVEDLDLCWRLRRAGWRVRYVPDARVLHVQGLSAGRHPYRMLAAHHASAWRFARRSTHGPARLALPAVAAGLAARLAAAGARQASHALRRPYRSGRARRPAGLE